MKKLIKSFMLLLTLSLSVFFLTGCAAKPEDTVTNFMTAIAQLDFDKAVTYLKNDGNKINLKYDDEDQEKLIKSIFSKIEYQIDNTTKDGSTATVKAKITSVDLPNITTKMFTELLPTLMAQAFSGQPINEDKQDEAIMQYYLNAINSPTAPKTVTEIEIKLVKEKEGWLIEPTDNLFDAMTGNIQKAFEAFQ
ncbi:lipoprotein [Clostridium malenominatum]|uniref:Lipoprotein n=1 Tax=Clostridium malenominatum TaxID=1539 RepID=A0ABN1IXN9_9CLOT